MGLKDKTLEITDGIVEISINVSFILFIALAFWVIWDIASGNMKDAFNKSLASFASLILALFLSITKYEDEKKKSAERKKR